MVAEATSENQALQKLLGQLQVDAVGVASLADWQDTRLGEAAKRLLPTAQSVVVVAMEIFPEILAHSSPEKMVGEAALRDILAPHLQYIDGRLARAVYDAAQASRRQGLKALPLPGAGCPVDPRFLAAVFSFKHAAQAAGLGVLGKSSLLITPQFGPRVRLACALTEAKLDPTPVKAESPCVECGKCLEACPAGALTEPASGEAYAINKFACSSFRVASGACSECMKICPL